MIGTLRVSLRLLVLGGVLLIDPVARSTGVPLRQAQLEDFEFARTNYVMKSKAFAEQDRRAAIALIDDLKSHAGSLSPEKFLVSMLQITAFPHNAHDSFDAADGWIPPTRLPLRMLWFSDALVIARAAPGQSDLLGAKVQTVEDLKPDELLAKLRAVCGASDGYLRWNVVWIIENGGLLHAARNWPFA